MNLSPTPNIIGSALPIKLFSLNLFLKDQTSTMDEGNGKEETRYRDGSQEETKKEKSRNRHSKNNGKTEKWKKEEMKLWLKERENEEN